MIAVHVHAEIVLAGVVIPEHRLLEVVDELPLDGEDGPRSVITAGEARALVSARCAEPVRADFEALPALMTSWQAR